MKNNPIKLRIVFMGTSQFSAEILKALLKERYNIISVYTQPDKKVGRKQQKKSSPVKNTAQKNKIEIKEIEKFDPKEIENLRKQKPDIILVVAYGKILPKEVLEIPGFGALNVHASLLPKYRGPSPVQNAILNGEQETGSTLMLMDEGIDSGDIIFQEKIPINPDEKLPAVMKKMSEISQKMLIAKLPLWIKRKLDAQKQDSSKASFCQLIERNDGKIFWNEEAEKIYNKFKALYPWPGIFSFWNKNSNLLRIKLNNISVFNENKSDEKYSFGKVIEKNQHILVKTAKNFIEIHEIQIEGKKNIPIKNFINGYPDFIGSTLK